MTAAFAEWKPYTNPRTKKSGWISAGGQVRYDDPRKAEEAKAGKRATAEDAFNAFKGNKQKLTPEGVQALRDHLNSLTRDKKRELARSISAHVGGLKSQLVDRLLAYAQGQKQPPYPKKPPSQTLVAVVQRYGGIDPNSHAFKGTYTNMREAIQDGINLGVFRKGGNGLDALAEEMHNDGYIRVPEGKHPAEHLLEQLKAGMMSRHADVTKQADEQLAAYERLQQEADEYAKANPLKKGKVKAAKKKAEEMVSFRDASDGPVVPAVQPPPPPPKLAGPPRLPQAVDFGEGEFPADFRKQATGLMGKDFFANPQGTALVAAASNAHDGAEVSVQYDAVAGRLMTQSHGKGYAATRDFRKLPDGRLQCYNVSFHIGKDESSGNPVNGDLPRGADMLANQVKALREMGVSEIKMFAAGNKLEADSGANGMVGYKVWPKLGYDGPLREEQWAKVPPALKATMGDSKNLSALVATPEGRDWWADNGSGLHLRFDLTDGSHSMKTLESYLQNRKEAVPF